MNTKTIILLAVGGLLIYFVFLKPKPAPTGAGAILGDLGKLVGDFGGNNA